MPNIDNHSAYMQKLNKDLQLGANKLLPALRLCSPIDNYHQLLLLDKSLLELLAEHEQARVDLWELNDPSIDFRSSGHYRDKLEIFKSALNESPIEGGYIYMDGEGKFLFNLVEDISRDVL